MKVLSNNYKDYQDIVSAIGTALKLENEEDIKELCRYGMAKKYLVKNGQISLEHANKFIRDKLKVDRAYHFAHKELLNLKEFTKIYKYPSLLRVNKQYIYWDGFDYYSNYNLDNEEVTEAWRLQWN